MDPLETLEVPDGLVVTDHEEYGPGDSFDPLPEFLEPDEYVSPDWSDEVLFYDAPDDDEERDDEHDLVLLVDLGLDLDVLDEPAEPSHGRFLDGIAGSDDGESDDDEMAA